MPLLVLVLIAGGVAIAVAFVAWHYPTPMASPTPSLAAAKAVGRQLGHHGRLRRTSPAGSIRGSPLDSL